VQDLEIGEMTIDFTQVAVVADMVANAIFIQVFEDLLFA